MGLLGVERLKNFKTKIMKNSAAILLFILFSAIHAVAQLKMGLMAGPGLATFGGSEVKEWGSVDEKPSVVLRFHGGLFIQYSVNEKISIASGLQYAMKGTTYSGSFLITEGDDIRVEYKKVLSYLEMPVQLQYALTKRFSFLLGPQFSLLARAKVKNGEDVRNYFSLPETEDAMDSYKKFDMALSAGPAFSLNEKLSIQLIYQHGLMKIGKYDEYGADVTYDIRNRVIRFSLIYMLKK